MVTTEEILLPVDNLNAYLRYFLFVIRYNCLCFILVCLHTLPELLPKKGTKSEVWCYFGLRHEAN